MLDSPSAPTGRPPTPPRRLATLVAERRPGPPTSRPSPPSTASAGRTSMAKSPRADRRAAAGRGTKAPDWTGPGSRILVFKSPADPAKDPWPVEVADDSLHIVHNFYRGWQRALGRERRRRPRPLARQRRKVVEAPDRRRERRARSRSDGERQAASSPTVEPGTAEHRHLRTR